MDTTVVAFSLIVLGAVLWLVIPALIKMKEEGQTFKLSYLWGLCVSIAIGAVALLPEEDIVEITFKTGITLVLAGAGMQGIFNKANAEILKKWKG